MESKLYNHQTKQWEIVPSEAVADAVKSGQYTFESGIQIPVVGADGNLYDIPSEKAYEAFSKDGFRWATEADKSAYAQAKNEAILEKQFGDDEALAFGMGAARGLTFGLSDVVADQFGAGDAAKEVKDRSPIASGAGQAAGILAGSLAMPLGAVGRAGEAVGAQGAAKLAATFGETSLAARAAKAVAPLTVGGAAEGGFYGIGEGVSEAALGKPEDIATNLVSGVTLGALTGGAFGAAISGAKLAKPFLDKAADVVTDAAGSATRSVSRKVVDNRVRAAMTDAGEAELADIISKSGLVTTDAGAAVRDLYQTEGAQAARAFAKDAAKHEAALAKEAKRLENGLRASLKDVPKETAKRIDDALKDSANDAVAARNRLYQDYQQADGILRQEIASLQGPRVLGTDLQEDLWRLAQTAHKTGDAAAQQKANEIIDSIKRGLHDGATEGGEINALRNLKSALKRDEIGAIANADARQAFLNIEQKIIKTLENHPRDFVRESFSEGNRIYEAVAELGKAIGKQYPKMPAIQRMLTNPELRADTLRFAEKLGDLAPELEAFSKTVKNASAQKASLEAMRRKLMEGNISSESGKISLDDMKQIIEEFGITKGSLKQRIGRIEQIKGTVADLEGKTPLEQAVILDRAAKGGKSDIEKFLPYEKQFDALDRAYKLKADSNDLQRSAISSMLGGMSGGTVGGMVGFALGQATKSRAPSSYLTALRKIEKASYQGQKRLQDAFKGATAALTGKTVVKASRIASGAVVDRSRYDEVRNQVSNLTSPEAITDLLSQMDQTSAPNVQAAIAQKVISGAQYLQANTPKNPLEGYEIRPDRSRYKPSDLDISRYLRRVAVVNDPVVAIEAIQNGNVTNEQLDALKNVHPETFAALQQSMYDAIITSDSAVPYKNRLILKQVFGIPTDYTLRPEFLAQMQSTFKPADQGGRPEEGTNGIGQTKTEMSRKSIDLQPQSFMTDAQKITYKGQQ